MNKYLDFSLYYDSLTANVEYSKRADYIIELMEMHKHEPGLTLDLACGTGNLLFELLDRGIDAFGLDASGDMLSVAMDKAYDKGYTDLLLLNQPMQKLDLYGGVDTVICIQDSLNHLKNLEELKKTFQRVKMFLNEGGLFVFDVNTIYKHEKVLADNCFVYESSEVFCVWQNSYEKKTGAVNIKLDFFEHSGKLYNRREERIREIAYPLSDIEKSLKEAGFKTVDIYGELSFTEPGDQCQRAFFVAS